jgi:hypothetical protein
MTGKGTWRGIWQRAGPIVLPIVFSLVVAEPMLRLVGHRAFKGLTTGVVPYEPDGELGWRNRPGIYHLINAADGNRPFTETILPDGSRATRLSALPEATGMRSAGLRSILFFGCSFTRGFGIDDRDVMEWKVQERFPSVDVSNYGVGGYGTLQSLLLMKRLLGQAGTAKPALVVYGFNSFHAERNVGAPGFLSVMARGSQSQNVKLPVAALGPAGSIQVLFENGYPLLPLRQHLALVTLAEESYMYATRIHRTFKREEVTRKLILMSRDLTEQHGVQFVVLLLRVEPKTKEGLIRFLERERISYIDGDRADAGDSRWLVPGDTHPNGQMHGYWAELVAGYVEKRFIGTNGHRAPEQ